MSALQQLRVPTLVVLVAGLLGIGLLAVVLLAAQRSNQIVSPFPGGPAAPIVSELPSFIADLKAGQSLCLGDAQILKRMKNERRLTSRDLDRSQHLYVAAKSDHTAGLALLEAGLVRRFRDKDKSEIERRLQKARQSIEAFANWTASKVGCGAVGAFDPLAQTYRHLLDWLNGVDAQNAEAIKALVKQLKDCELPDWDAIR